MARWRAAKEVESGDKERRPYLASECHELPKCEKFRLEIIREISKKVAQIQNGKVTTITATPSLILSPFLQPVWVNSEYVT